VTSGGWNGIFAYEDITIKGGKVTATAAAGDGIYTDENVYITGGDVIAAGLDGCGICGAEITIGKDVTGLIASGTDYALGGYDDSEDEYIPGTVKNAVAGTGWTDTEGTEGKAEIAISTEGQELSYLKAQFPAAVEPETQPDYSGFVGEAYYKITVKETENGKATASRATAPRGATVTVTATPADGYELDSITAKDARGNAVTVTDGAFTMPASDVTVTVTFKAVETAQKELTVDKLLEMFDDLDPNGWYLEDVLYCVDNGCMEGMGDHKFGPEKNVSRAMVAQLLWNMAGNPEPVSAAPFDDVAPDAWYAKAVAWAYENGVTKGTGAGFEPDKNITREQLAVMLYNYAKLLGKGFAGLWSFKLDFPDAGKVSEWATEAVSWMVMNGVIKGTTDDAGNTILDPQGYASRAMLAAMVHRFCELIK
jgi:hypothetical protein